MKPEVAALYPEIRAENKLIFNQINTYLIEITNANKSDLGKIYFSQLTSSWLAHLLHPNFMSANDFRTIADKLDELNSKEANK